MILANVLLPALLKLPAKAELIRNKDIGRSLVGLCQKDEERKKIKRWLN